MSKKLIAYFSVGGATKSAAVRLAKAARADLFEIKPTVPYSDADLDWTNKKSRSSIEMSNPASRPEIAELPGNMKEYDTVFIGFPIWWYVAPAIILTFLESCDFSGKTIIPFATSGSSGFGKTAGVLKSLCSETAKWLPGKMMNKLSEQELYDWVRQIEE